MGMTLVARILKTAEDNTPPPGGETENNPQLEIVDPDAMKDKLESMIDDPQTTARFLEELNEINGDRTAQYLHVIRAEALEEDGDERFASTWDELEDAAINIAELESGADPQQNGDPPPPAVQDPPAPEVQDNSESLAGEDLPSMILEEGQDEEEEDEEISDEGVEDEEVVSPSDEGSEEAGYKAGVAACQKGKIAMDSELPQEVMDRGESYAKGYRKAVAKCKAEAKAALEDMNQEGGQISEEEKLMAQEPVATPATLDSTTAQFDMVLFGEDTDNPHYSVFADGKPVAEIRLEDQPRAAEILNVFISEDYPSNLVATMEAQGAVETLEAVKARFYVAQVHQGEVAQRAASKVEGQLEEDYAERLAALKENFLNTTNLAVMAANKGQFVRNVLRMELKKALASAGVRNAGAIIDDAWDIAAPEFFSTVFAKAEEWMGYSPEALHEVTKEILGSDAATDHENSQVESELEQEDVKTVSARVREASARGMMNVPIRTSPAGAPTQDETDLRTYYKNTMKFGHRLQGAMLGAATRHIG